MLVFDTLKVGFGWDITAGVKKQKDRFTQAGLDARREALFTAGLDSLCRERRKRREDNGEVRGWGNRGLLNLGGKTKRQRRKKKSIIGPLVFVLKMLK